jgi:hypothetical protein
VVPLYYFADLFLRRQERLYRERRAGARTGVRSGVIDLASYVRVVTASEEVTMGDRCAPSAVGQGRA